MGRYRDALAAQLTALKNRLHEKSSSKVIARNAGAENTPTRRGIATLEQEVKRVVNEDEAFKRDFELLTAINGVGPITAMTVLAEIGDLRLSLANKRS